MWNLKYVLPAPVQAVVPVGFYWNVRAKSCPTGAIAVSFSNILFSLVRIKNMNNEVSPADVYLEHAFLQWTRHGNEKYVHIGLRSLIQIRLFHSAKHKCK